MSWSCIIEFYIWCKYAWYWSKLYGDLEIFPARRIVFRARVPVWGLRPTAAPPVSLLRLIGLRLQWPPRPPLQVLSLRCLLQLVLLLLQELPWTPWLLWALPLNAGNPSRMWLPGGKSPLLILLRSRKPLQSLSRCRRKPWSLPLS